MVQLIGKGANTLLSGLLEELLIRQGRSQRIEATPAPAPLEDQGERLILLFRDSFSAPPELPPLVLPKHTVAIVNAQNVEMLQRLEGTAIQTIPCGLSSWDTFTLASSTEESQVVALQRSITNFQGEIIEPMEFPVHNPNLLKLSRYNLMALCAVGCLAGGTDFLLEFFAQRGPLKTDTKDTPESHSP